MCVLGTGCVAGKAWEVGADSEGKTGGDGGTRVQCAAVIGKGFGNEGVECSAKWMAAGDRGVRGQPGQWG